jgi:hypothetical protein
VTVALLLDAGALIALDRNDRRAWALLRVAVEMGSVVAVPAVAVGKAWRDGARQVLLTRALRHCDEVPLDGRSARAAGLLCGRTGTSDVIDASVAVAAAAFARVTDLTILTSDPDDIGKLVDTLGIDATLERV